MYSVVESLYIVFDTILHFQKKIKLFFITLDEKEPIQYLLCKEYVGYFLPINENSSILK
mgnify:CR=1 FL=1